MIVTRKIQQLKHSFLNTLKIHRQSSVAAMELNLNTQIIEQLLISNNLFNTPQEMMKNIKIISHRGRSDLFPQNTLESISQALVTSDLAEFDVMLTKDNEVIVFHDRFLGQTTNINDLPEFKDRLTIENLNEHGQLPHPEWWVKQFTLNQIKKLSVRQKHATRPQIKERQFKVSTLDEVLKKALEVKSTQQKSNNSGLLLQIKTQRQNLKTCPRDIILLQKIHECLKANNLDSKQKCQALNLPIIVQSFNQQSLRRFHDISPKMSLFHLYGNQDQEVSEEYLAKQRTPQSLGVAVSYKHMSRQFVQMCRKLKYQVFYWSVVDDNPEIPFGCKNYEECYQSLKQFNIDGIITDFASNCKNAIMGMSAAMV